MSTITTHILDVSVGRPARGVPVVLEFWDSTGWCVVGRGSTDEDGRLRDLLPPNHQPQPGSYCLIFETTTYFAMRQVEAFYPEIRVTFTIRDAAQHYHVPLLLSPFGYSTYRGS